jgi:hypothetical protein
MDYARYLDRLQALAASLARDPDFEPNVEIEPPVASAEIEALEQSMARAGMVGVSVWESFRAFHGVVNGFLFQWLYRGTRPVARRSGSAWISQLAAMYLPAHIPAEHLKKFFGTRRVLDRISENYEVAVIFREDVKAPELHYFSDETGDFHRLRLDFDGYLEMMLEARALFGWQAFFVDDRSFPFPRERAEAFRDSLKTLFPDATLDHFRPRPEPSSNGG